MTARTRTALAPCLLIAAVGGVAAYLALRDRSEPGPESAEGLPPVVARVPPPGGPTTISVVEVWVEDGGRVEDVLPGRPAYAFVKGIVVLADHTAQVSGGVLWRVPRTTLYDRVGTPVCCDFPPVPAGGEAPPEPDRLTTTVRPGDWVLIRGRVTATRPVTLSDCRVLMHYPRPPFRSRRKTERVGQTRPGAVVALGHAQPGRGGEEVLARPGVGLDQPLVRAEQGGDVVLLDEPPGSWHCRC
jgi:hypothetical protein